MSTILRFSVIGLSVFTLFTCKYASGLIIPEELPTILSLIYSNIPPIKKGTDSRVGVGFRLGEHADFQFLVELGPQTETDRIGSAESARRRDAMYMAAMQGELGPFARAVAKYQIERKILQELERLKKLQEITDKSKEEKGGEIDKKFSDNWLKQWRKGMSKSSSADANKKEKAKEVYQKIRQSATNVNGDDRFEELMKLYRSVTVNGVNGTVTDRHRTTMP